MNSRTLNGLPSGRSSRTSRVAFPVPNGIFWVLRSGAPAQEGEKWYLNTRISGPFRQTTNQAMPTLKAIQADAITAPSSFI
jgi:hypothetical protein